MSGPRAFPCGDQQGTEPGYGMTLRDWFAGQALVGWLSADVGIPTTPPRIAAAECYAIADAMMAERERT